MNDVPWFQLVPQSWWAAMGALLGLVLGSFLNVVIYRVPRELNIAYPASSCPNCGQPIRIRDNLPVLGWLALRGRARCCGAKISARYPLVELIGAGLGWACVELASRHGSGSSPWQIGMLYGCYLALCLGLVAAVFIDFDHMILPDSLTLGGAALGLVSVPLRGGDWWTAVIGGGIGFAIVWFPFIFLYERWRGTPGMGLGDAKLLLLCGVWFGWSGSLFVLMLASVQGTCLALALYAVQGRLEEPEAVRQERQQWLEAIEAADEEERQRLEAAFAADPVLSAEPTPGFGKARLAFGPFLGLAAIEFLFLGEWMTQTWVLWLNAGG